MRNMLVSCNEVIVMEKEKVFSELNKEENRGLYVEFFATTKPICTIDDFLITECRSKKQHKADLLAFRVAYRKDNYSLSHDISIDAEIFHFTYDGKRLSFLNRPSVSTCFSQCYVNEKNFDKKKEIFIDYVKNFIPDLDFSRPLTLKQIMKESEKTLENVFREHGFEVFKDKLRAKNVLRKNTNSKSKNKKDVSESNHLSL